MLDEASLIGSALPPFRERAPWFGGDLQTLRNIIIGGPPERAGGERLLLAMPDGDRLAARLDRPGVNTHAPLIVLAHGLAGSESSRHGIATARYLVSQGWPALRLNLRGAAPSRPTSGGRYHAGKTDDLAAALRALPAELTRQGIVLIGNSLGGNLVLKFIGEGGHGLPVRAAIAVSTPIDLAATCARMMAPRNVVYHRYMLDHMKREALAPGAELTTAERAAIAGARSVYEFDDRFVALHFGYRGAQDYYDANAAKNFLAGARLPTLILQALDDPWIPAQCYTAIDWATLPAIQPVLTKGGGHMGFHGADSLTPWHDRVTAHWLARQGLGPKGRFETE
ncbi:MAG: alpha/beta fold hydrolase [Alphaproteobacteria bacterium]|nr:alpha/beta fold hydrolase [Alphaproteobacteria bacterium]